jgi:hypothetical protein
VTPHAVGVSGRRMAILGDLSRNALRRDRCLGGSLLRATA